MSNQFTVKDGNGNSINFNAIQLANGNFITQHTPSDPTGNTYSNTNPFPVKTQGEFNAASPRVYTEVAGSPFILTNSWQLVTTTTSATMGLRIAPIASATTFDIEWCSTQSGTPTVTYGEPVLGGEDFLSGLPIGLIYLKSASGQIATVKTGA